MKNTPNACKFLLLIIGFLFITPCLANESPKKIRGVIVGYQFSSYLIVRTNDNQYLFIRTKTPPANPLPETVLRERREWTFAVKPVADCNVSFSFLRWKFINPGCGVDHPIEPEQPAPARALNPYPQLSFVNPAYRKELEAVSDETKLSCFDLDLNHTKPSYPQREITGIVVAEDGTPMPQFAVSVGFSGEKRGYVYVLTDSQGRFSIPVFENFSYWIKPGVTFNQGEKQYKATPIPKKIAIKPLILKLQYEETSN